MLANEESYGNEAEVPLVSVLVPTKNSRDLLQKCLETLEGSIGDFQLETIVVDDGSTDGTGDMVRSRFPDVRLIRNEESRRFASATNQALHASRGNKVLLLNSDIELPSDAIEKMLQPQPDGVVAVAPLLRGLDGQLQREYTFRKLPSLVDLGLNLLFFRRIAQLFRLRVGWDSNQASAELDIDLEQPSAACLLIEGHVLRELGGLDESLPLWFNDVDLCKQLHRQGHRIRLVHDVSVVHWGGASISKMLSADRVRYLYADTLSYVKKWHPRAVPLFRFLIFVNLLVRSIAALRHPREVGKWLGAIPRLVAPIFSKR